MPKNNYPGDYDRYLFHQGRHYESYNFLGSHITEEKGKKGVRFTVWAPNAEEISVIGDFNDWNKSENPMQKIEDSGIWTTFIEGAENKMHYKYWIRGYRGVVRVKTDPYAKRQETPPKTASQIYEPDTYSWSDQKWLKKRKNSNHLKEPLSIYEMHLGSWKQDDGELMNYRDIADELVPYINEMGFTHVELMPLTEYPFPGSWGYQTTGYFALTSRYGTLEDFMYFVDQLHQNDIGVIMDWVPSHFCKDDHGLRLFDGSHLFESSDPRRAENIQWDTLNFDFAQNEIWSFLISSANYWIDKFHIDGLRVDAVSNMLYLNYEKEDGQWAANEYGGFENLEAIEFIKELNSEMFERYPGILMIAEESSAWPLVTAPVHDGGLGFNFKWNMGWMNDTLDYMENDPVYRKWEHNKLTFSSMYSQSENYVLPMSHDEVVHGKKSLLDKMPGDYWQKFANLRLLFTYMYAHPGKKLLFMGGEFGQFIEWNYKQDLDWLLLDYEKHQLTQDFMQELNQVYRKEKALWELDHEHAGFRWIEADDYEQSVISFIRNSENEAQQLVIILNFTPVPRDKYRIGVPGPGEYELLLNSDQKVFGGSDYETAARVKTEEIPYHGFDHSISINLPPLAGIYLKYKQQTKKNEKTKKLKKSTQEKKVSETKNSRKK
ncbi:MULTISPECIES: 1,4-alpha-glucan branching protein GlgB [Halanaerobium]|uniref:1,4-alpha-glucan branching enzyme GlgB n=1 Tax=Halanaerobium saccharolyticum TaxID=43595 RepID=A0A4R6SGC3_9FIRM|nr:MULTISPECIES: 1,4-alpha-glucan branching protein GlgB [Halanaerobium]PUU92969.1 MAG: 1,4-alpha-glucan branching enzyme [Halanaerobium sp.]TDP98265.1 1,4-alpha-glucan branching enzyme [Halanaerobium saccharolyticum]